METALIVSVAAWFIGSFICGLCGLGVAIIAIPFMIWVLPVQDVVLISCLTLLGMMVGMGLYYMRYCTWKIVLWMALGTIPGSLVGILVLKKVSSSLLELIIGMLLIFCIVGLQAFQDRIKISVRVPYSFGAGILGGIIGTCATIDGPVVGLYGLLAGWKPQQFLAITSVECAVLKGGCTPGRTGRDFFPKNAKAQNRKTGLQKTPIAFFSARWKC